MKIFQVLQNLKKKFFPWFIILQICKINLCYSYIFIILRFYFIIVYLYSILFCCKFCLSFHTCFMPISLHKQTPFLLIPLSCKFSFSGWFSHSLSDEAETSINHNIDTASRSNSMEQNYQRISLPKVSKSFAMHRIRIESKAVKVKRILFSFCPLFSLQLQPQSHLQ